MLKKMVIYNLLVSISFLSAQFACDISVMSDAKRRLVHFYESRQFEYECQNIVDAAIEYLQSNEAHLPQKKTVIFDIENTVLLSFKYCKETNFCKHCYDLNYDSWVSNADWPTIKPIKDLYNFLVAYDYKIIFLSCRLEDKTDFTIKNLFANGYTEFEQLILKPLSMKDMPSAQYKSLMRNQLVDQGHMIVASVGDQKSDFECGNCGYRIKIPNYIF